MRARVLGIGFAAVGAALACGLLVASGGERAPGDARSVGMITTAAAPAVPLGPATAEEEAVVDAAFAVLRTPFARDAAPDAYAAQSRAYSDAEETLRRHPAASIPRLLRDLESGPEAEQQQAERRLTYFDTAPVPGLVAMLNARDASARVRAAGVLLRLGDPASLEALSSALKDANPRVRALVFEVLVHSGGRRGVPFDDAVGALLAAGLRDPDAAVRSNACWAASQAGDPGRRALLDALASPDESTRPHVALAILRSDERESSRGWPGRRHGPKAGTCEVVRPALIEAVRSDDESLRGQVVRALGPCGDCGGLDALRPVLADDPVPRIRADAASAMREIVARGAACSALGSLTSALARDPDVSVRVAAATALGGVTSEDDRESAAQALLAALGDAAVAAVAARELVKFPAHRAAAVPVLINQLEHGDWRASQEAADALARAGDAAVVPVAAILGRDTADHRLRVQAVGILGAVLGTGAPNEAEARARVIATLEAADTVLAVEAAHILAGRNERDIAYSALMRLAGSSDAATCIAAGTELCCITGAQPGFMQGGSCCFPVGSVMRARDLAADAACLLGPDALPMVAPLRELLGASDPDVRAWARSTLEALAGDCQAEGTDPATAPVTDAARRALQRSEASRPSRGGAQHEAARSPHQ